MEDFFLKYFPSNMWVHPVYCEVLLPYFTVLKSNVRI